MLAPALLVLVMLLANRSSVVKQHTSGPLLNSVGWITTIVMAAAAIGALLTALP